MEFCESIIFHNFIELKMCKYRVRHLKFLFQVLLISRMVTISSCLIWQIISFSSAERIRLFIAWISLGNIATLLLPILAKNHLFRWSSFWSWLVCKQAKFTHLGHSNPYAYIEKLTHPKRGTVWCEFWSRGIIEPFFFENKQGEAVTVNGGRYLVLFNKFLFT